MTLDFGDIVRDSLSKPDTARGNAQENEIVDTA
jgi:hypothetical protein